MKPAMHINMLPEASRRRFGSDRFRYPSARERARRLHLFARALVSHGYYSPIPILHYNAEREVSDMALGGNRSAEELLKAHAVMKNYEGRRELVTSAVTSFSAGVSSFFVVLLLQQTNISTYGAAILTFAASFIGGMLGYLGSIYHYRKNFDRFVKCLSELLPDQADGNLPAAPPSDMALTARRER